jgi:hypothetical protein
MRNKTLIVVLSVAVVFGLAYLGSRTATLWAQQPPMPPNGQVQSPSTPPPPGNIPPPGPPMMPKEKRDFTYNLCICPNCPSYVECGENVGYCLRGKSGCIKDKKGCLCSQCPVTQRFSYKWGYYCVNGSAAAMSAKEAGKPQPNKGK